MSWAQYRGAGLHCHHYFIVRSANGEVYIADRNFRDGRWSVFEFENAHLRKVAEQRSPLLHLAIFDGGLFCSVFFVIPTLLLGAASGHLQRRRWQQSDISTQGNLPLAGVVCRGVARAIDLTVILLPLGLSVALHPDVMEWWLDVMESCFEISRNWHWQLRNSSGATALDRLFSMRDISFWQIRPAMVIPVVWLWIMVATAAFFGQVAWQGWTGRTLGKWLLGLKVLRTSLRPCGFSRSLLRELLFALDSALLVSWVPGMISILVTQRSQRIGDWAADTVVIRDFEDSFPPRRWRIQSCGDSF
jgi:uncharacterized RDD family membrane protein YckC